MFKRWFEWGKSHNFNHTHSHSQSQSQLVDHNHSQLVGHRRAWNSSVPSTKWRAKMGYWHAKKYLDGQMKGPIASQIILELLKQILMALQIFSDGNFFPISCLVTATYISKYQSTPYLSHVALLTITLTFSQQIKIHIRLVSCCSTLHFLVPSLLTVIMASNWLHLHSNSIHYLKISN